ncbi:MAG: hypothetical protein ABIH00_04035 [Armatimonadota bacterium]
MRKKAYIILYFAVFVFLLIAACSADTFEQKGLFTSWFTYGDTKQCGFKFIPEAVLTHPLTEKSNLDIDIAIKADYKYDLEKIETFSESSYAKLYRGWARYSTDQLELRAGLQKINFGPAQLLRSLRWFDQLDPRDPLHLTDGVNAVLGRYYFINNANIWLWGLYGNKGIMGLEVFETNKKSLEPGGRWQFPVPKGEMGISYNRRYIDHTDWNKKMSAVITNGLENKYGLDGYWDIGIGCWFEACAAKQDINPNLAVWDRYLTVGADYTFDIGPGVHILAEHFTKSTGYGFYDQTDQLQYSAVKVDFSLNMLDSVNLITYYDHFSKTAYPFFGFQRLYDDWQINVNAFNSTIGASSGYLGKGVQLMVTYNY